MSIIMRGTTQSTILHKLRYYCRHIDFAWVNNAHRPLPTPARRLDRRAKLKLTVLIGANTSGVRRFVFGNAKLQPAATILGQVDKGQTTKKRCRTSGEKNLLMIIPHFLHVWYHKFIVKVSAHMLESDGRYLQYFISN